MGQKFWVIAGLFVLGVACGSSDGDGTCQSVQGTWTLTGTCTASSCTVAQTGCSASWSCDDGTVGEGNVSGTQWSFTTGDGTICSGSISGDTATGSCTTQGLSCELGATRPPTAATGGAGGGSSGNGGTGLLPGSGGGVPTTGGGPGSGGAPPGGGPGSGGLPPVTGGAPGSGGSGGGSCVGDLEPCTVNGDCCGFASGLNYCVDTGDATLGTLCLFSCTSGAECASGCCAPLQEPAGASVCAAPEYCAAAP